MDWLKTLLKKYIIPEALLKGLRPFYHGFLATAASWYFRHPSKSLVAIGITGTAGKSTTAAILAQILNTAGKKCGYVTTVDFFDGEQNNINKHGLSMPGGWLLQKQLKMMREKGCKYAVVECTSEGLAQNRHLGIDFSMAIFTNLSAAHLEAHGGFGKYRQAKGKLFEVVGSREQGTVVVNLDDENAEYFLKFKASQKVGISFEGKNDEACNKIFQSKRAIAGFEMDGVKFEVKLLGEFNIQNAGLAAAAANILGVDLGASSRAIFSFDKIRGRMETVPNNRKVSIIVDYGCEPASFESALKAAKKLPHNRVIHVFGSTGGHRDVSKRFEFGKISAQFADQIIITNDDIYDSDPEKIASDIELGIKSAKSYKLKAISYQIILDRRQAICRALEIAQSGDIILITGKGSEQFLVLPGNKRIGWDEVSVVKEELNKLTQAKQE